MTIAVQSKPAMQLSALIEKGRKTIERIPLSVPQLLARLAIANVFWRSGQTKLANWDITVQLFQDEYRVPILPPDFAATMAASFELGCSALLAVGLFTRLATLPLLGMTLVIQLFVYPNNWPDHLLWTALLVFLFSRGGGAASANYLLGRLLRTRSRGSR